jgi:hypothetical protein
MALLPHPVNFAWIKMYDAEHPNAPVYQTVLNSQLDATTHATAYRSFSNMCERWRLAYASVTVYQDGADLANQGTLVVAQVPSQASYRYSAGPWNLTDLDEIYTYPKLEVWDSGPNSDSSDLPNFDASQGMPNAYFGRSREGAYVPLKLTDTCQEWRSASDEVYWTYALERNADSGSIRLPVSPAVTDDRHFPHYSDTAGALHPAYVTFNGATPGYAIAGAPTSPMLSGNVAHICARNLALTTSYSLFFRFGIEMQVKPQSFLAPQMKLSPPYDSTALDAYFAIARELKDAYPADYNDLGKLWDVIKRAANLALPAAAAAGPYGMAAATAARAVISAGDAVQAANKVRLKKAESLSAADVERIRDASRVVLGNVQAMRGQVKAVRKARKKKRQGSK